FKECCRRSISALIASTSGPAAGAGRAASKSSGNRNRPKWSFARIPGFAMCRTQGEGGGKQRADRKAAPPAGQALAPVPLDVSRALEGLYNRDSAPGRFKLNNAKP